MKKRISIFIVLVVFATCLTFMLSSCDKNDHIHSFVVKNPTEKTLVKEATCTSKAEYYFECQCGLVGEGTYEYGSLLKHEFIEKEKVDATCTTAGKKVSECKGCGMLEEVTVDPLGHNEVIDEGYEATCFLPGKTEGSHCSSCNEVLVEQKEIPVLEHNVVVDPMVEPTCTSTGLTEGSHCSICNTVLVSQKVISSTGHSYSDLWTTDETHHWNECSCGAKTNKALHIFDNGVVEVEATETIEGIIKYTCMFCDYNYTVSTGTLAHTHTYSDTWSSDDTYHWHQATCSHNDLFIDRTLHDYDSGVITIAPTCTTTGVKTFTCNSCGKTKTDSIDVLGHNLITLAAVAPTCTETGLTEGKKCDRCNEVIFAQRIVSALGHNEVVDQAVSPTCTTAGLTEGSHCDICNAIIVVQNRVSALGHNSVIDNSISPTCTETGLTEGSHCIRCNTVLVEQTTIDSLGHVEVIDNRIEATCTKTGLTEGSHCSRCNEVLVRQEVIDLIPHTYASELSYNDTNHWYECSCKAKNESSTHTFDQGTVEVEATETVEGIIKYSCTVCEYNYSVNTGTLNHTHTFESTLTHDEVYHWYQANCGHELSKDKAEHNFDEGIIITAPTCTEKGIKLYTCKTCSYEITEEINELGHDYQSVVTNPTCLSDGYTTNTCSRCSSSYISNQKTKLGHLITTDNRIEATCTTTGLTEGTHCSRCNITLVIQEEIPALGHNQITDSAVSPTCTTTGLTEGSHCLRCNEVLIPQSVVSALGHTNGETVVENNINSTCTENGSYDSVIYCEVCGVEVSRTNTIVESLGHSTVVDSGINPTCTTTGLTEGSHCSECSEVLIAQEAIAALGHDFETNWSSNSETHWHKCSRCDEKNDLNGHSFGEYVVTLEPTTEASGSKERTCSICSYKDVVSIDKLTIDLSSIEFESIEVLYTGENYSIYAYNLLPNVTVSYEGNGVSEVGTHTVTAKFYSANNVLLGSLTATISIIEYDVVLPPIE